VLTDPSRDAEEKIGVRIPRRVDFEHRLPVIERAVGIVLVDDLGEAILAFQREIEDLQHFLRHFWLGHISAGDVVRYGRQLPIAVKPADSPRLSLGRAGKPQFEIPQVSTGLQLRIPTRVKWGIVAWRGIRGGTRVVRLRNNDPARVEEPGVDVAVVTRPGPELDASGDALVLVLVLIERRHVLLPDALL